MDTKGLRTMKNKLRLLGLFLAAVLALCLLPVAAGVEDVYNIWIDDTRVTSENCGDILGNGAFSYDPVTKTLTIQKSYEFIPRKDKPCILCGIKDLVIYVKNDCTLSVPKEGYATYEYLYHAMFNLSADTTITGPGRLTLQGALLRPYSIGILVRDHSLTLQDADILITEWTYGIAGNYDRASLTVKDTALSIHHCYSDALGYGEGWVHGFAAAGFPGGITLSGERLADMRPMPDGPNEEIKMKLAVMYSEEWERYKGMAICVGTEGDNHYGDPLWQLDLVPGYDLRVNGVYVDEQNKNDILGNGAFSYDPGANTLHVKKSFTQTASAVEEEGLIHNRLDGLIISADTDCTLNGTVYAVQTERDLRICGDGTLTLRAEGTDGSAGIHVVNNSNLSVEDTNLYVYGGKLGAVCGANKDESLTVVNSTLYARSNVSVNAIGYLRGGIDPGGELSEVLNIPAGGKIQSGAVVNGDGSNAREVRILPGSFNLWIDGTGVTSSNREDILGNGVFSFDGVRTLTIKGDYTQTKSGALIRSGVKDLVIRVEDSAALTANKTGLNIQADASLEGGGKLTVVSGSGSAIAVSGGSTLSFGGISLDAKGVTCALEGSGSAKLVIRDAEIKAKGGTAAVSGFGGGIQAANPTLTRIVYPVGGMFKDGAVTDSLGNHSKEATIKTIKAFKLNIDGLQVTEENMSDVLGNGVFSFDGDHTLTINGDYTGSYIIIDSSIFGLVIRVAKDSTLQMSESAMGFPIFLRGDTTITGPGKLTLVAMNYNSGLEMGSGDLTLKSLDLTVKDGNAGIHGSGSWSPGKLTIDGSTVHANVNNTWNTPIDGFQNGIELINSVIAAPEDGIVKDGRILNGDETLPADILIRPAVTISVSGNKLEYSIVFPSNGEPARLIAAWYDSGGKMLGCSVNNVTQDGPKTGTITVKESQKEYRLFVLDKNGKPLTAVASLKP